MEQIITKLVSSFISSVIEICIIDDHLTYGIEDIPDNLE